MGKKFIIVGGKKYYIKDESAAATTTEEEVVVEEGAEGAGSEETAEEVAKQIIASLGLNDVKGLADKVDLLIKGSKPVDSKLMQILNGKDYLAEKDQLTKEEKIVGFFHALVTGNDHATKALAGGVAADGGYLIPDEFMAELQREIADLNVLRSLVRVVPMRRDVMKIPSLTSSVDVYWTAENAAKTTTTARFGEVTLTARKMAAIIYASDEMIDDASDFDMVRLITTLFAERIADREEQAITAGNGTTQPTGLETARAAGTIAAIAAVGQNFDDIISLEYALPAKYANNAVYLANRTTVKNLRTLKDSQGRYIWQAAVTAGQPATINGKPIYEANYLPNGTVYYGDFKRGYWLGDRQQVTVKVTQDSETAFTKDQTAIRVVERIAGNVVWGPAIKALTGF